MNLSKTLWFSVTHHPIEEIESMVLVFSISGWSQPINSDRNGSHDNSCGNSTSDISSITQEETSNSKSKKREIPTGIKSSVEVSRNTWIDSFVDIHLILIDLAHLLLPPEQLKG